MQPDYANLRNWDELTLDAMLSCLHPATPNEDAALIHALRWAGFALKEIEHFLDAIKRRRA